jgi:hypothetical protein
VTLKRLHLVSGCADYRKLEVSSFPQSSWESSSVSALSRLLRIMYVKEKCSANSTFSIRRFSISFFLLRIRTPRRALTSAGNSGRRMW